MDAQLPDSTLDAPQESSSIEFMVKDGAKADGMPALDTTLVLDTAPAPDTLPWPDTTVDITVDAFTGRWTQANQQDCPSFCSATGRTNVLSPEGAYCMSGEVRPQSGIDQGIVFTFGCWPDCTGFTGSYLATSAGWYCYGQSQSKDNDPTDWTVGCFCL
jgi:hypothetical protein